MKVKLRYISVFALLFIFISCVDSPTSPDEEVGDRGEINNISTVADYDLETIQQFFSQSGYTFPGELKHGLSLRRIVYSTVDPEGNPVKASGALLIPDGAGAAPLFSLQHGTVFRRNQVTSESIYHAAEGVVAVVFTSNGYVTAVPDYLGYGVSEQMHPYIHAEGNAPVVIDFIRAVRAYCDEQGIELNGQLFLGGYSEGGYVTLATQKRIESSHSDEIQLTGVAPCAGPYDLHGFMQRVAERYAYPVPENMCFLLTAYNEIYGWERLPYMFQEPYAEQMQSLFNGSNGYDEINNVLPDSVAEILQPGFIEDLRNQEIQEIISAFRENSLLDWAPKTPVHFFHGEADKTVDVQNSLAAYNRFSESSTAEILLTTYEGMNHSEAAEPAFRDMFQWFETLRYGAENVAGQNLSYEYGGEF